MDMHLPILLVALFRNRFSGVPREEALDGEQGRRTILHAWVDRDVNGTVNEREAPAGKRPVDVQLTAKRRLDLSGLNHVRKLNRGGERGDRPTCL